MQQARFYKKIVDILTKLCVCVYLLMNTIFVNCNESKSVVQNVCWQREDDVNMLNSLKVYSMPEMFPALFDSEFM